MCNRATTIEMQTATSAATQAARLSEIQPAGWSIKALVGAMALLAACAAPATPAAPGPQQTPAEQVADEAPAANGLGEPSGESVEPGGESPATAPTDEHPRPSPEDVPPMEFTTDDGEPVEPEDMEMKISGDVITVDDLEVRHIACELEDADLFALVSFVSALSEVKPALDACAPSGAALRFELTWTTDGGSVVVEEMGAPDVERCVAEALGTAPPSSRGTCGGVVLVGDPVAATALADEIAPVEASDE